MYPPEEVWGTPSSELAPAVQVQPLHVPAGDLDDFSYLATVLGSH